MQSSNTSPGVVSASASTRRGNEQCHGESARRSRLLPLPPSAHSLPPLLRSQFLDRYVRLALLGGVGREPPVHPAPHCSHAQRMRVHRHPLVGELSEALIGVLCRWRRSLSMAANAQRLWAAQGERPWRRVGWWVPIMACRLRAFRSGRTFGPRNQRHRRLQCAQPAGVRRGPKLEGSSPSSPTAARRRHRTLIVRPSVRRPPVLISTTSTQSRRTDRQTNGTHNRC